MSWLRRAGRGSLADGGLVSWSVAEGCHGRRWRWTVVDKADDGGATDVVRHAGLLELDPDGRFARLELASTTGLLTLHPDDGRNRVHGNVVRPDGVEPIDLAWTEVDAVGIESDPFGSALAKWQGRGLLVRPTLRVEARLGPAPAASTLGLDARGIPILAAAAEWALET